MAVSAPICGIYDCETCTYRECGLCAGCVDGNRQLQEEGGGSACAVYTCAQARAVDSCLDCSETVCSLRRTVESICPLRSRFEKPRWWAGRMSRVLQRRKRPSAVDENRIPDRVVSRLRWYLTALDALAADGHESVSSWRLAELVGVNAALIRKDLSRFGGVGTPSFGYRVDTLRRHLQSVLRLDASRNIVWVGARAYRDSAAVVRRLGEHNCRVIALFDTAEEEIGAQVGEITVLPADRIRESLAGLEISAAVLAIRGEQAHEIARTLVDLGARAILNLSAELLVLPDHVRVTSVDLAGELLELCYYCQ
ncbi:MAG: redox-sensing transcriptional repressor Rex [Armatimonadota bacterium]